MINHFFCEGFNNTEQLKKEPFFSFSLDLPLSWECESVTNKDSSFSKTCLDTIRLHEHEKIRAVSVSQYSFFQKESTLVLEKSINLIKSNEKYDYISRGKHRINGRLVNWIVYKHGANFNVTYYLFDRNFTQVVFSISADSLKDKVLCQTINFIESIKPIH